MVRTAVVLLSGLGWMLPVVAQKNSVERKQNSEVSYPTKTLNFSQPVSLLNLPKSPTIGYPLRCSSVGNTFISVYADAETSNVSAVPELYRITRLGEVKRLGRKLPQGFTTLWISDFFAGDQKIISLVGAKGQIGVTDTPTPSYFFAVSDEDGSNPNLIELRLPFEPVRVAIFDSGEFLVLGLDTANRVPVLALLNEDGTVKRSLDLDNREYDTSKELQQAYSSDSQQNILSARVIHKALQAGSFIPVGNRVMFLQPGSSMSVRLVSDQGEEKEVKPHVPDGYLLENALASESSRSIFLRLRTVEDISAYNAKHIIEGPKDRIFEFDWNTGRPVGRFETVGPQPSEITCAVDRKLTALFYVSTTHQGSQADETSSGQKPDDLVIGTVPF